MKYRRLYSLFLVLLFAFSLTSCSDPSAGKYASACSLFGEGRVYEAKNIFITIPEYEDASAYLAYIEAADKEAAQEYAGAAAIFDSLADFRDSRDRAKYCSARQAESEERYEDADLLYQQIPGYSDSSTRIQQLPALIVSRNANRQAAEYLNAQYLLSINDLDGAVAAFSALPHYEQSNLYLMYAQALQLLEADSFESAKSGFLALGSFLDSSLQASYCSARIAEAEQRYEEADAVYQSLTTFRDCAARHAAIPGLIRQREYDKGVAPFLALAGADIPSADDGALSDMLAVCGQVIGFLSDPVWYSEDDANLISAKAFEADLHAEQERRIVQSADALYGQAVSLNTDAASSEELAQAKQWCEDAALLLSYNTELHADRLSALRTLESELDRRLQLSAAAWLVCDPDTRKYGVVRAGECEPVYEWDSVQKIGDGLYLVSKRGNCGVVSADGTCIVPCEYHSISIMYDYINQVFAPSDLLVRVYDPERGELYGVWKSDGTQALSCEYSYVSYLGAYNGRTYYSTATNNIFPCAIADDQGNMLTEEIWDRVESFSDGLFLVEQDNVYCFLDVEGNEVFSCPWKSVDGFHDGRACVWSTDVDPSAPDYYDDAYGYIDTTGEIVIPVKWGIADSFSEGLAPVYTSGGWRYIDTDGNVVIRQSSLIQSSGDFFDGFAEVSDYDATTPVLINRRGAEIAEDCSDYENRYLDGFVRVKEKGKWGMVDQNGKTVIPCEMNAIEVISCTDADTGEQRFIYIVEKGNQSGVFDPQIGEVRTFEGEWDGSFFPEEQLLGIFTDDFCGCVNLEGEIVVPCLYDENPVFSEGFGVVLKDGLYGYITASGEEIIPCTWDFAAPFSHGLALVRKDDALQVIDTSGDVVRTIPMNCEGL